MNQEHNSVESEMMGNHMDNYQQENKVEDWGKEHSVEVEQRSEGYKLKEEDIEVEGCKDLEEASDIDCQLMEHYVVEK